MSEKKAALEPAPEPGEQSNEAAGPSSDGSPQRPEAPEPSRAGLGHLFGLLARRGREELERAASQTRVRLDLRQLRRDREAMYAKVGREVRALLDGGEIQHPGLARGVDRIREIEKKIADVEAEMASAGIPVEPG